MPSPVTSASGAGAAAAAAAPIATGSKPSSLSLVFHRHSQMPPPTIKANAQPGIEGKSATAPLVDEMAWASARRPSIAPPLIHQNGVPQPTASSASAAASLGMMTNVVSGMAMMFPNTP